MCIRDSLRAVTTTTLDASTNLISEDEKVRRCGIEAMKQLVDINLSLIHI